MNYKDSNNVDDVIRIVTEIRKYREDMNLSKKELVQYCFSKKIGDEW
ncbi:Uncharacterised protein, partial [Mycoplasmopsis edwardii]